MNIIIVYERGGKIAVGELLRENEQSCRVMDPEEGESKVPSQRVWLTEETEQTPARLAAEAREIAAGRLTADTLWAFAQGAPLSFGDFAEVHAGGDDPLPLQVAALMTLVENPAYFRRAGAAGAPSKRKRRVLARVESQAGGPERRFIPAAHDDIRAALRSQARRDERRDVEDKLCAALRRGETPREILDRADELLFSVERKTAVYRALARHCGGDEPDFAGFFMKAGVLKSAYDYHRRKFLYHWPAIEKADDEPFDDGGDLPLAAGSAFSIDDQGTIEIDDAFSVRTDGENLVVGVHIALPALGVGRKSAAEHSARKRMISVYFPEAKHPMLPRPMIDAFSLTAGEVRPVLSLYTVFDEKKEAIVKTASVAERISISANYSSEDFTARADEQTRESFARLERFADWLARRETKPGGPMQKSGLATGGVAATGDAAVAGGAAAVAKGGSAAKGGGGGRREFKIKADAETFAVSVAVRRERPEERVVALLMVYLNQTWGETLATEAADALFRSHGRIQARPPADEVPYAWCSSPLRRYVDLFNQRRLLALVRKQASPSKEHHLDQVARRFDKKHDRAKLFQGEMERFWALTLAARDPAAGHAAEKTATNRGRLSEMPIGGEVKSPRRLRPGVRFTARVTNVDLIKLRAVLEMTQ